MLKKYMLFFRSLQKRHLEVAGQKFRSRPGKPNQRKGQNEKFMNFAHFCEFWCFSLGKQARFTLNFCSRMPLRKVHEPTFLWFGLPGPLLKNCRETIFVSHLSRNYPHRGVAFPLLWGRDSLGGILGDNLGEGYCESKIASRQWGDNFGRETSICLAGPSGHGLVA